jgi:kexin
MIDAGLFVERAESWTSVKPQAWFDSPAQMLPTDEEPATSFSKRQEEAQPDAPGQDDPSSSEGEGGSDSPDAPVSEPEPEPAPKPQGTIITEEGITSTFTVTRDMLDESNLEKLEHITARVWITHDRRGDVEVELKSPNGIVSVLARARRFDEDSTGFDGWKFMSLRHWYVW